MDSFSHSTDKSQIAKTLNLLVWTQYFWPENFRINDIVHSLKEKGIEVSVLTGKPNYPAGNIYPDYKIVGITREDCKGVKVTRIPLCPRGKRSAIGLITNYLSFVISGIIFAPKIFRDVPLDAILVYAPSPLIQAIPAILLARKRRIPLILWVQDLWPDALKATGFIKSRMFLKLIQIVMRFIYAYSDSILIQSEGFRSSVERMVSDRTKIIYYPNAAELNYKSICSLNENYELLGKKIENSFSIVFAGNLGRAQGCSTIVKAAALLKNIPDIHFFLIGDGSESVVLSKMIKELNLSNVSMPGVIPAEIMQYLYSVSSALLISLILDEGLSLTIPSKLQSYLLSGRPIIASINGEAARIVLDANAGFVCTPEDAEDLANSVINLYNLSSHDREHIGNNGKSYAMKNFNLEALTKELIAHVYNIIKNSSR